MGTDHTVKRSNEACCMDMEKVIEAPTVTPPEMTSEHHVRRDVKKEPEKNQTAQNKNKDSLPIDRGWAWVVLVGATYYLILFGGIRKNFGIFFVAFQSRFNTSASTTSLVVTIQAMTMSVSSLFVMTIGMHYMSHRTSVMVGSFFLTVANLINANTTNIYVLFASFGIVEGLGISLVHPPTTSIVSEYFSKRRGFANGLAFSGANFGGLVFAPVVTALFEFYGYTGTMMIVAGMNFNIMISGALMRPLKSFQRKKPPIKRTTIAKKHLLVTNLKETEKLFQSDSNIVAKISAVNKYKPTLEQSHTLENDGDVISDDKIGKLVIRTDSMETEKQDSNVSPLLPRFRAFSLGSRRQRTISETSHTSLFKPINHLIDSISKSKLALYASTEGFSPSVIDEKEIVEDVDTTAETKSKGCLATFKSELISKLKLVFDKELLWNPVFLLYISMAMMFAPTCIFHVATLAPYARDIGLLNQQTGVLMSVVGGVGMLSRLTLAVFVDRKLVRLTTLLGTAGLVVGTLANCTRFFTSFNSLVIFAVILGLSCELYQAMYTLVVVEYLGLSKLRSTIGFTILSNGIANAVTFPVVGFLRDATGSYLASYHFLGSMSYVGAILAFLIPVCHRKYNKSRD